jgi:hypothetical protein
MASNFRETAVKTVVVDRSRLASTLANNLETHQREYLEARSGYESKRLELIRKLSDVSLAAYKNNTEATRKAVHEAYNEFAQLEKPVDHSDEYKQAIRLMEWETRDKIELSINDFECYVEDNWQWKHQFKAAHANYSISNS